jgi:PPOX class probable F420-dependent enzyme
VVERETRAQIAEKLLDLFLKKSFAHLATLAPHGPPHVTPVWVDYDGQHVLVNSAKGRVKDRNMSRRPSVALIIIDPDNPYRYLSVQGTVEDITEEGHARTSTNWHSATRVGRCIATVPAKFDVFIRSGRSILSPMDRDI